MSDVDTSAEAVERRADRMEAAALAYKERAACCGEVCSAGVCCAPACHFGEVMGGLQDGAATLRALLSERDAATARAEAVEVERDAFKRNMEAAADLAARYGSERDAATAERDRLREALRPQLGKNARRSLEELAEAMEASGDAADATALRFLLERQDAARAALAGAAKETGNV